MMQNPIRLLLYTLMCNTLLFSITFAQSEIRLSLTYGTNEFELKPDQKMALDSFIGKLNHYPEFYSVATIGHTDNVGSKEFNEKLALNRASKVSEYLIEKSFSKNKIVLSAFIDSIGTSLSEVEKSKNRRVEIIATLNLPTIKPISAFAPGSVVFNVSTDSITRLVAKSGTSMEIKPGIFEFLDGTPVKGSVQIKYTEYRNPLEFLSTNIAMSHINGVADTYFESSGMFEILGTQNEVPIRIKKGEAISMEFKPTNDQDNVNFYEYDSVQRTWTELSQIKVGGNVVSPTETIDSSSVKQSTSISTTGELRIEKAVIWMKKTKHAYLLKKYADLYQELLKNDGQYAKYEFKKMHKYIVFDTCIINLISQSNGKYLVHISDGRRYKNRKKDLSKMIHKGQERKTAAKYRNNPMFGYLWEFPVTKDITTKMLSSKKTWLGCNFEQVGDQFNLTLKSKEGDLILSQAIPKKIISSNYRTVPEDSKTLALVQMDALKFEAMHARRKNYFVSKNKLIQEKIDLLLIEDTVPGVRMDVIFKEYWKKTNDLQLALKESSSNKYLNVISRPGPIRMSNFQSNNLTGAFRLYGLWLKRIAAVDTLAKYDLLSNRVLKYVDTNSIQYRLNVSGFGVYNCDQVRTLDPSIDVTPRYVLNDSTTEIRPTTAYLVTKDRNGVITYGGYTENSPRNFKANKFLPCILILVDVLGDYFIVDQDEFRDKHSKLGNRNLELKTRRLNLGAGADFSKLLEFKE